jgi:hypothetical protein
MHRDKVTTWVSDSYLDEVYETLRKQHCAKPEFRLNKNYGQEHVKEVSAKTIYWNDSGEPEIVCSILIRPCWPANTYRILNRLWKVVPLTDPTFAISSGFSKIIQNQISWCTSNNAVGVFMSRQGPGNWQKWANEILSKQTNINFYLPDNKFLTCDNTQDDSCWQKIIFHGDTTVLNTWSKI